MSVKNILKALEDFEKTPEARALHLRLSLAEMVLRNLKVKGWTQRELAARTGIHESHISQIVHSEANCTLGTIGKILVAFGLNGTILESEAKTQTPMIPGKSIHYVKCLDPTQAHPERETATTIRDQIR